MSKKSKTRPMQLGSPGRVVKMAYAGVREQRIARRFRTSVRTLHQLRSPNLLFRNKRDAYVHGVSKEYRYLRRQRQQPVAIEPQEAPAKIPAPKKPEEPFRRSFFQMPLEKKMAA